MLRTLTLTLLLGCGLAGCAVVAVGGLTVAGAAHDRRTMGTVIDDVGIRLSVVDAIQSDEELAGVSRIKVTSYNGVVLVVGETPRPEYKTRIDGYAAGWEGVRRVINEVRVMPKHGVSQSTRDQTLSTKVKAALLRVRVAGFDPTRVKVMSVDGTVYLMGLLTAEEAVEVVDIARRVSGVQRVVRVFETL